MPELFNQADDQSAQPAPVDNQPSSAPAINLPPELSELVGEGKKYGTVEAALASIVPAQQHISTLEQENNEYKAKLESNDKLDTILQKLGQPTEQPAPTSAPAVNVGDIVNAVKQDLQQEATAASKASNRASVEAKLTEKFGEQAPAKTAEIASSLNMSIQDLTRLVETSPQAALQLMGVNASNASDHRLESDVLDGKPVIGEQPKPKSVMFGAKSADILAAWRAAAPTES